MPSKLPTRKEKNVSVDLRPGQKPKLEALARRDNMTVASYARAAINWAIENNVTVNVHYTLQVNTKAPQ